MELDSRCKWWKRCKPTEFQIAKSSQRAGAPCPGVLPSAFPTSTSVPRRRSQDVEGVPPVATAKANINLQECRGSSDGSGVVELASAEG